MSEPQAAAPAPAAVQGKPARILVMGTFEDEVRAEQAVRALEVWRRANRGLGLGTVGVVAHHTSGATTVRTRGVLRPGRGALAGLVIGLVLLALPAAGAAWLAVWVVASIVLALAGLVGAVPAGQAGPMALTTAAGFALLAAVLAGGVGGAIGCLLGLVAGFVDSWVRGLSGTDLTRARMSLPPGSWATVARARPEAAAVVQGELTRLGGTPAAADGHLEAPAPAQAAIRDATER